MFPRNSTHSQHPHLRNTPEASRDNGLRFGVAERQMAPPSLNYLPQPVEIDPLSYTRAPGSYAQWDLVLPTNSVVEAHSTFSSTMSVNRTGTVALEFPPRNNTQDGLANWYSISDSPWVPRGALPEVPSEDRPHARGIPLSWRGSGYGPQFGIHNRPGNPSDSGSVPYGVPQSDSGYGTALSLESASARGSDVVDHAIEMRSLTDRIPEMQTYSENGPLRSSHDVYVWSSASPHTSQYRCETCQKPVKTKSELKKHHLRHTKPHCCKNPNCSRTEGFSTINDLDRHMKSKHPNDCPEELLLKTYHCLVDGCKSKDKKWPRLDNFRSHLKRMHDLSDEKIEDYVRRVDLDRKPVQPLQRTSIETHRMDQRTTLSMEETDEPELSYHNEPAQWSQVSSAEMSRHTEMIDSILQMDDRQTAGPPNNICHSGKDDNQGSPGSPGINIALREPDDGDGCLRTEPKAQSTHLNSENLISPRVNSRGSLVGSLDTQESHVKGKAPKSKRISKLDPYLREAIAAVFSKASTGNDTGSDQDSRLPLETVMSDTVHAYGISPKRMDSELSIPSPMEPSGGNLDGSAPCSGASASVEPENKDLVNQEQNIQEFLKAIQAAGYILKKDPKSTGLGHTVDHSGSGPSKKRDQENCPLCTKFRGRPCEVKKHMKRHKRPYGCTFPGCPKTFGSKNDWKRHENSQHYQHETWRCDEETNGKACGKVFYTADSVRNHFTKTHKVEEPEILEHKIAARRIGPNHQKQFWCGFCLKIIDLSQKGVDAWAERFNHIDDHFMGRKNQRTQSIIEWKPAIGAEERYNVSAKPLFPNEDEDKTSSDEDSMISSYNMSPSPIRSAEITSDDAGQAISEQRKPKRKRPNGNLQDERASKQSKSGKAESRIICCQCSSDFNPKTDTACYNDDHVFCSLCIKRQVEQFTDST